VLLDHEIEQWDNSGEAWVWVRMPTISSSSNTEFYMYYGNPSVPDGQNPTAVWDDNFVMVQHLVDVTTSTIEDSTVNDNDGTKKGAAEPIETGGKIGEGQDFDGNDDKITVSDSPSLSFTGNELTIEAWVKIDTLPGTHPSNDETAILRKDEQWQIAFQTANSIRNLVRTSGTTGWTTANDENYPFSTDTWYYWTFVYNGLNIRHLINAQQVGSLHTVTGNIIDNSRDAEIGRCVYTDKFLDGIIDEVRVSKNVRSADWIEAQYLSMTDNFITYSNQPPDTPGELGPTEYVDGSRVTDNTPTLEFTQRDPEGDRVQYQIQIRHDSNVVVDYTSELLDQDGASFTVGQAEGAGLYAVGNEGQTLDDGDYCWQVRSIDEYGAVGSWSEANGGDIAFLVDALPQSGRTTKDKYYTHEDVAVTASGFPPDADVDVYVTEDRTWSNGESIPPYRLVDTFTADGSGNITNQVIWTAPLEIGEYDVVFDAGQDGFYDELWDLVDDPNHPGFVVVSTTVGGEVYPVDKAAILLSWLGLGAVLIIAASCLILVRRRSNK
jgi:hypothetical protein